MANLMTGTPLGKLPAPLGDMPGAVVQDSFYVLGGGSGEEFRDSIWRVDSSSGECTEAGRLPYAARGHQAVTLGDSVYILGGFDGQTRNDVWRLSSDFTSQEQLSPMPQTNSWFSATAHQEKIVVVGGFSIPSGYLDQVMIYDPAADQWEVHENALGSELFSKGKLGANALTSSGDALMTFGGADEFNQELGRSNALNVTAKYNLSERTWEPLPDTVAPREGLVVVKWSDAALLIGGMGTESNEASSVIEKVSLADGKIEEAGRLSMGRLTPAAGIIGRRLIVAGGVIQPLFEMTDSIEYLDLVE